MDMRAMGATIALLIGTSPCLSADDQIGIYMSGTDLTDSCRAFLQLRREGSSSGRAAFDAAKCYGFVVGIMDKTIIDAGTSFATPAGIPATFCTAPSVNANDATEVVARFLDEHPQDRQLGGYFLVVRALGKAYPCQKP